MMDRRDLPIVPFPGRQASAVDIVVHAASIPEEQIPHDVTSAVTEFLNWKLRGQEKPEWLRSESF